MDEGLRITMKKIGEYIAEMDELLGVKVAFIPAPQGQSQPGQNAQAGQAAGQSQQLMQQISQMAQQMPPEVQQQVQQAMQQIQQLPPDQQAQALQQVAQGMQQMTQQGGQPQGGGASQQQQGGTNQEQLPPGHMQAENDLDNTRVTLTVRELMDLTSGGKATQSHLKVKQLVDSHNQKMQQSAQQAEQQAQQAQIDQQAAAQGLQSGGLYAQAPDMSGKNPKM